MIVRNELSIMSGIDKKKWIVIQNQEDMEETIVVPSHRQTMLRLGSWFKEGKDVRIVCSDFEDMPIDYGEDSRIYIAWFEDGSYDAKELEIKVLPDGLHISNGPNFTQITKVYVDSDVEVVTPETP